MIGEFLSCKTSSRKNRTEGLCALSREGGKGRWRGGFCLDDDNWVQMQIMWRRWAWMVEKGGAHLSDFLCRRGDFGRGDFGVDVTPIHDENEPFCSDDCDVFL
eukprot:10977049-Ditylum_brightwellii.AAC.1